LQSFTKKKNVKFFSHLLEIRRFLAVKDTISHSSKLKSSFFQQAAFSNETVQLPSLVLQK
jgi:hypothetical protein